MRWWLIMALLGWMLPAAQAIPGCDPDAPLANGVPVDAPNGAVTVYFECYAPDESAYTVFALDHRTDTVIELGETALDLATESIYLSRWLDATRAAFRAETGGGTYNWRSVYLADVTEPGSLKEIARDYVARPRYFENPPRYEWAVEDGVNETVTVYRYDVTSSETDVLYTGGCIPRDDLANALSCHMVTPSSNADYLDEGEPTRLLLNIGDSAREIKTIEVRSLPDGERLYTVEALGMGYGEWLSADTVAVFNLTFDFESAGFAGQFVQFSAAGRVVNEAPFVLPNGAPMTLRPPWMEAEAPD